MTTDATENHDAARRDGSALSEGLGPLPEPDMTLPSVAPDSPDGAHFYRASTVRRLLDGERERCAALCEAHAGMRGTGAWTALTAAADRIRDPERAKRDAAPDSGA